MNPEILFCMPINFRISIWLSIGGNIVTISWIHTQYKSICFIRPIEVVNYTKLCFTRGAEGALLSTPDVYLGHV